MTVIWKEVISGKTYELHRSGDGKNYYVPPLPDEEISKRQQRDLLFKAELKAGQIARGETDDTFFGGMQHFSQFYGEEYAERVKAKLKAQGVPVTSFTDYEPSLAEYEGDPRAVLQGRSTIRRRKEVLARAGDRDPLKNAPKLSERLINEQAIEFAKEHPDEFAKMTNDDVQAHMIEKHGSER